MKKKEDLNFVSIKKKIYLMKIVYINDLTFDLNILRHTIPPEFVHTEANKANYINNSSYHELFNTTGMQPFKLKLLGFHIKKNFARDKISIILHQNILKANISCSLSIHIHNQCMNCSHQKNIYTCMFII